MKKLTLEQFRPLLEEVWGEFQKTDEELLKTDFYQDCQFDSIDFQDLFCVLYIRCDIAIDNQTLIKASFYKNPTVENFIKICNKVGK